MPARWTETARNSPANSIDCPAPMEEQGVRPARRGSPLRTRDLVAMALVGATLRVAWWRGAPLAVEPGAALTDAGRVTGFLAGTVAPVLAFFHRSPTGALRAE
jgi:hypothetical protein